MRDSPRVSDVTGPALVIMCAPRHDATLSGSVRSPGATTSHSFFFSTALGTAGAGCSRLSPNHTRSPTCAPAGGAMGSTRVLGSSLAASTMPALLMPRMLRGLRLAAMTTSRPVICSMGTYLTSPLTMVRGSASPMSIFSTYRLSASGCLSHEMILPTLKSMASSASLSASLPAPPAPPAGAAPLVLAAGAAAAAGAAGAFALAAAAAGAEVDAGAAASASAPVVVLGTRT
mmetsp:Transcript_22629/g.57582  ORF Transcript_22629/g.57582 Transcript_22629/m.57582 type:complete len:231 (+) Transcript_22629:94-786(+)